MDPGLSAWLWRIAMAKSNLSALTDVENRRKEMMTFGERVSRNVNEVHAEQSTFGQKVADGLAATAGSWPAIIGFLLVLLSWIFINSYLLVERPFDPYPFILLNLVLSGLAGIQAPVIMMSQNRQAARDRIEAELDFQVNRKAEMEVEGLHSKLDQLREQQWAELVKMQQHQIALLEKQIAMLEAMQAK
jgi:uncharacterized membrane protein